MKPSNLLSTLLPLTSAYSIPKDTNNAVTNRIPTAHESAILARRILTLTPLGTISTIFPSSSSSHNPPGIEGKPHALMEYISACDPLYPSHPTLLSLNISSTYRNAAGSNLTLAMTWTPPPLPPPFRSLFSRLNPFSSSHSTPIETQSYSAAALPRYSLMGYLEPIEGADDPKSDIGKQVQGCYTSAHPDAKYWLPGNRIHESHFVRLVVTEIYWVGGFGDRAYIGWIDAKDWESVTKEEIEGVRLPREKPVDGEDL